MPVATPDQVNALVYGELSPRGPGQPLDQSSMRTLNNRPEGWFGTGAAEGYTQALLTLFDERHPDASRELRYIVNEAKWSTGYRDFGRMVLELLG